MFKKAILSAVAALSLLFAVNAPANAAMAIAKPEAGQAAAANQIIQVRRGGFRRHGGFRRGRWHGRGRHWRHARYWRWGRYWASPWAWYHHCNRLQRHGRRIACYRPY